MSVVAATVLMDRVLIAADSRLTLRQHGGAEVYVDNALKLFVIGPFSVLGVVGNDALAAADIVQEVLRQVRAGARRDRRRWRHPLRLALWLPSFLSWAYRRRQVTQPLSFLLAFVVPGVPTVLQRAQLGALIHRAGDAQARNWLPGWLPMALLAAQEDPAGRVEIMGTAAGGIRIMESPHFAPREAGPLSFAAIGSGGAATIAGLEHGYDLIFAGDGLENTVFDQSIGLFCRRANIATVGGLRPTYEIGPQGVRPRTAQATKRIGHDDEEEIRLDFEGGTWMQRNVTRGIESRILPLWHAIREAASGRAASFEDDFFDV